MTEVLTASAIILVLIGLNGVFVAAEFAIVGAPRAAVERRAAAGDRIARIIAGLLRHPRRQDRFIASAQLGITLASLGLGMYGEHIVAAWLIELLGWMGYGAWLAGHTIASIVSVTMLTYLHIVLGEMIPKSLALHQPEATARWVTPLNLAFQSVTYPLVVGLNGLGNGILKIFGIHRDRGTTELQRTPGEIRMIVRESQAEGLLRPETSQIVQELLSFSQLQAEDVMVPRTRVVAIKAGMGREGIRQVLRDHPHTRYPVYAETIDNILGMVHVRSLLLLAPEEQITAQHAREVAFVPSSLGVEAVMRGIRDRNSEMAVVMDEHGGTAGIVTVEDLVEEIIGDIAEETHKPDLYADASGGLHAAGTVRLEEVGSAFGTELEYDDVHTVSGLVLALLGREPAVGDRVSYRDMQFRVIAVEGHGVAECLITRQPPKPPARG